MIHSIELIVDGNFVDGNCDKFYTFIWTYCNWKGIIYAGSSEYTRHIYTAILDVTLENIPRNVFAMKSVQNLKSFWRSSQNDFVCALFSSL
jgi:hypothetical protein